MLSKAVILSLIAYVFALPTGAPICRKNSEFTSAHGSTPDKSAPFSASVGTISGLTAPIQVKGSFKGLLLYVNKEGTTKNVGSFAVPSGFQYVSSCAGQSTLTHTSDAVKTDPTFTWTAPGPGTYLVNAILTGGETPWNEFSHKITIAGGSKTPGSNSSMPHGGKHNDFEHKGGKPGHHEGPRKNDEHKGGKHKGAHHKKCRGKKQANR